MLKNFFKGRFATLGFSSLVIFVALSCGGGSTDINKAAIAASAPAGSAIATDEEAFRFRYGVYGEAEIELVGAAETDSVIWEVVEASVPPGLELEATTYKKILLFGEPLFTGQWCFALSAKTATGLQSTTELCPFSDDNAALTYPRFTTDRLLPSGNVNRFYQTRISVDKTSTASYTSEHYDGLIPNTFDLVQDDANYEFILKGRPTAEETVLFALSLEDASGVKSYRQFQLVIDAESPSVIPPDCPAGYYYDNALGYCVQESTTTCPPGTYWDPSAGACVQYPAPPPQVVCPPNTYFDPYSGYCIRSGVPRCPVNYRWDSYYNRCVRKASTCPPGYRYDWITRQCEYIGAGSCPRGEHYDYRLNRCVRNGNSCPAYHYSIPNHVRKR